MKMQWPKNTQLPFWLNVQKDCFVLHVFLFLNRSCWFFCANDPPKIRKNTTVALRGYMYLFIFLIKKGQQLNWRTAGCKMQLDLNAELVVGLNAFARALGWSAPGFSFSFSLWRTCKLQVVYCLLRKSWMGVGYNLGCYWVVQVPGIVVWDASCVQVL